MATLEERIAAATGALEGGARPQRGSSLDDRIAAASKALESPAPATGNYYWNAAKQGVTEGIGNIADVIPRASQLAKMVVGANMIPLVEMGLISADRLPNVDLNFANTATNALRSAAGVQDMQPADKTQEVLGGIVRGAAGSAMTPMGPGGILANILKTAAVGGAAGGGAVMGGQAAESLAPDNEWAKLAGQLAGGVVGGVVAPSAGGVLGIGSRVRTAAQDTKAVGELLQKHNGSMTDALAELAQRNTPEAARQARVLAGLDRAQQSARPVAEKMINRQVTDAISGTPNAPANITEALRLRDRIPGFNPSVAEMADSPGLTDMQRRYFLSSPQRLNEEVARDAANVSAVRGFYDQIAPPQGPVGSVRTAVNQNVAATEASQAAQAQAQAGRLPTADQVALGGRMSELATAEMSTARPAINAAYQKAFDTAGDATIDIAPVIAKTEEILGTKLAQIKPESAPQTVAAIQRIVKRTGDSTPEELAYLSSRLGGNIPNPAAARAQITLKDVDDIRRALNADASLQSRSTNPMSATIARNLRKITDTLDESLANSEVPAAAKTAYSDAIAKYRTEFAPRFREGSNLKMFRDTSLNEPRIVDDRFISEYFKPDQQGGGSQAVQFRKLFGTNPEARDLTRTGILDMYRKNVVDATTGEINVGRHNAFMRDYGRTLTAYKSGGVNALDDIMNIGKEASKIADLQGKFKDLASSLRYDTTDQLVDAALKSPKVMGNVTMRLSKDQNMTFQRSLMDRAWESGTGAGMQKFLTDNEKTLKMALQPKHLSDMQDISKALAITERAPIRGALQAGGPDILKNATGVSMATVWAQYRATSAGRQGVPTMVFNLAAPVMSKLSQQNFNDVMQKALHDPATAKNLRDLMMAPNAPAANAAAGGLLSRIGSTLKTAGQLAWDSKADIGRLVSGIENYPINAGRAAPAIAVNTEQ